LENGGILQVGSQVISNDCTSFALHESDAGDVENKVVHIVFTTKSDTLHVVNLKDALAGEYSKEEVNDQSGLSLARKAVHPTTLVGMSRARMLKGANTAVDSLRRRSLWERGAQLVTTLGGRDVAVILQTVRGNLETIFPRPLVLGAIATALSQDNYQDAVILIRRHHINPNVLVDYKGWKEFITGP
jgi:elongator complex protein 1